MHALLDTAMTESLRATIKTTNIIVAHINNVRWRIILKALSLAIWPAGTVFATTRLGSLLHDISVLELDDITVISNLLRCHPASNQHSDTLPERLIQIILQLPETSLQRDYIHNTLLQILHSPLCRPPSSITPSWFQRPLSTIHSILSYNMEDLFSSRSQLQGYDLHPVEMPNPEMVFDLLMKRDARRKTHPSQISSMFFYLTSIISLDVHEAKIESSSSTLDLSPLYGGNDTEQHNMRQFKNGLLKVDCFASKKALLLPPGVGVLLVMLNRFHNYAASQLSLINESGCFSLSPKLLKSFGSAEAEEARDEDLFRTAKLITQSLYINIIKNDYLRTMLNLHRRDSTLSFETAYGKQENNARINTPTKASPPLRKEELSFIYSWNSTLSERDAAWMDQRKQTMVRGRESRDPTVKETENFILQDGDIPGEPDQREWAGFARGSNGSLSDEALAGELIASIEDVAGAFGARRVPSVLRALELQRIRDARSQNPTSLNEFRESLGLTRHKTFEDINPDPRITEPLRTLYHHPDNVELYPGLVIEQTKPAMVPGNGVCAGLTKSYAMLCDLASLVHDHPSNVNDGVDPTDMTTWGRDEFRADLDVDNGCLMHKLILRAFPRHFAPDSAYAHYPFVVPDENCNILRELRRDHEYSLAPPVKLPDPVLIGSVRGYNALVQQQERLPKIATKTQSSGSVYQDTIDRVRQLLRTKFSTVAPPNEDLIEIDLVKDVAGPAFARLYSDLFSLPLSETPDDGLLTEEQLCQALISIHAAEAYHEAAKDFSLQKKASEAGEMLRSHIIEARPRPVDNSWSGKLFGGMPRSVNEDHSMCPDIRALAYLLVSLQLMVIECLDYYLGEGREHLSRLQRLGAEVKIACTDRYGVHAREALNPAPDHMLRFMLEGIRLALAREGSKFKRAMTREPPTFLDMASISRDALAFVEPASIRLDRPLALYKYLGIGSPNLRSSLIQGVLAVFVEMIAVESVEYCPDVNGSRCGVALPMSTTLQRKPQDGYCGRRDSGICMDDDWVQIEHDDTSFLSI